MGGLLLLLAAGFAVTRSSSSSSPASPSGRAPKVTIPPAKGGGGKKPPPSLCAGSSAYLPKGRGDSERPKTKMFLFGQLSTHDPRGKCFTRESFKESDALARVKAKAKAEYEKLAYEAKKKAADEINEWCSAANVKPEDSFETVTKKVGGCIGAQGGNAACAAFGLPPNPACAGIGKVIGAYLGKELGPYIQEAWNWAEDQIEKGIDWAGDQIEEGAEYIYDNTIGALI